MAQAEEVFTYAIPGGTFPWKNEYPSGQTRPLPKTEWLAVLKDDPALQIPPNIITSVGGVIQNADPTGANTHCNWTWDGCVKPTDIVSCEDRTIWGTSFDDGPYQITKELLAYLKKIDVKVTFFVVGIQVIAHPEVMKQAFDEGHEIGIHTWGHKELTTLSNEQIVGELKWTELAIKEVLGVTPRLMRPPRGDIDDRVRYIVNALGYVPAMWSVDSQDWRITAGQQTEAGLLADVTKWAQGVSALTRGGNSLMHDLNEVTVGAALKALPILHPVVKLSPVGTCAGWKNESYLEYLTAQPVNAASSTSTTSPVVTPAATRANAKLDSASSLVKVSTTLAVGSLLVAMVSNFI
ncbi:hypothetical protein BDB01DRAFT_845117 [Pilobolus umbonatus]|nr:hypothetical protein BDB01DRAFT_845117 [Pilobolus umbonatus]